MKVVLNKFYLIVEFCYISLSHEQNRLFTVVEELGKTQFIRKKSNCDKIKLELYT